MQGVGDALRMQDGVVEIFWIGISILKERLTQMIMT